MMRGERSPQRNFGGARHGNRCDRPGTGVVGLPVGSKGRKTARMEKFSLDAIAREQARRAATAPAGRSAETVYGGHEHALRQTVLALTAGSSMTEHENPGEATVQVLRGRVRLTAGRVNWEGRSGDLLVVPDERHALEAVEDSVILLTVSKASRPS
jgi:quercetin dioxygenase-like cupin family protein